MTMRTMSLLESMETTGQVSLGSPFEGREDIEGSSRWDIVMCIITNSDDLAGLMPLGEGTVAAGAEVFSL